MPEKQKKKKMAVGNTADANTHDTSLDGEGEEDANASCRVDDEAFKKPYVH